MTQLPVLLPYVWQAEYDRRLARISDIIEADDGNAVADILASGEYDTLTFLDGDNEEIQHDLFYIVLQGRNHAGFRGHPSDQFRVDAFNAFVADGRVFTKPYGMLGVLARSWTYTYFYLIVASLIPDETWRQMTMSVLLYHAQPEVNPGRFHFDGRFPILAETCRRWGWHALTNADVQRLREVSEARQKIDVDVYAHSLARMEKELLKDRTPLTVALPDWLRSAHRRLCYSDVIAFVTAMVNTSLQTEVMLQITDLAFPCKADSGITRLVLTRIIDHIRGSYHAVLNRREQRAVSTRTEE
jgi:hypothetical protein